MLSKKPNAMLAFGLGVPGTCTTPRVRPQGALGLIECGQAVKAVDSHYASAAARKGSPPTTEPSITGLFPAIGPPLRVPPRSDQLPGAPNRDYCPSLPTSPRSKALGLLNNNPGAAPAPLDRQVIGSGKGGEIRPRRGNPHGDWGKPLDHRGPRLKPRDGGSARGRWLWPGDGKAHQNRARAGGSGENGSHSGPALF